MNTKEVLAEMAKGAILCMEHTPEGPVYWLEPKRIIVRSDVAAKMTPLLKAGGDSFFKDTPCQTWRVRR